MIVNQICTCHLVDVSATLAGIIILSHAQVKEVGEAEIVGGGVGVVIVMVGVVITMVDVAGGISLTAPLSCWTGGVTTPLVTNRTVPLSCWTGGVTTPLVTNRTVPLFGKWTMMGSRWSQGNADFK